MTVDPDYPEKQRTRVLTLCEPCQPSSSKRKRGRPSKTAKVPALSEAALPQNCNSVDPASALVAAQHNAVLPQISNYSNPASVLIVPDAAHQNVGRPMKTIGTTLISYSLLCNKDIN